MYIYKLVHVTEFQYFIYSSDVIVSVTTTCIYCIYHHGKASCFICTIYAEAAFCSGYFTLHNGSKP